MRKRAPILISIGCLLVLCAILFYIYRSAQPHYKGKSLSYWVTRLGAVRPEGDWETPAAAITHGGTNTLPYLLNWIRFDPPDSKTRKLVADISDAPVLRKFSSIRIWATYKKEHVRAIGASYAFSILGPAASNAIPDLLHLASLPREDAPQVRAIQALAGIGVPALPAMLNVISNTNSGVRATAIRRIIELGTNAAPAVPLLISCFNDNDPQVAEAATGIFASIPIAEDLVVPALISKIHDPRPNVSSSAMITLAYYGRRASAAVPAVHSALTNKDSSVRKAATYALPKIAPEASSVSPE